MRESWEKFWMGMARWTATRSTCRRRKVGAVAVNPLTKRLVAIGYNGAPSGVPHCNEQEGVCIREKLNLPSGHREELCMAVHAEQNLLVYCARHGVSIDGCHVFCTHKPCLTCLKMLSNAGVTKVYYDQDYGSDHKDLLDKLPIELVKTEGL